MADLLVPTASRKRGGGKKEAPLGARKKKRGSANGRYPPGGGGGGSSSASLAAGSVDASASSDESGEGEPSGILLSHRVLAPVNSATYLGTVVAYRSVTGEISEVVGTSDIEAWLNQLAPGVRLSELSPGYYRVLFDDGDVGDYDPAKTYEVAFDYHRQRQFRLENVTCGRSYEQTILGVDGSLSSLGGLDMPTPHPPSTSPTMDRKHPPVLILPDFPSIALSAIAGERELHRHANPPLTEAGLKALYRERLALWTLFKTHFTQKGVPMPEAWAGEEVGWFERRPSSGEDELGAEASHEDTVVREEQDSAPALLPGRSTPPPTSEQSWAAAETDQDVEEFASLACSVEDSVRGHDGSTLGDSVLPPSSSSLTLMERSNANKTGAGQALSKERQQAVEGDDEAQYDQGSPLLLGHEEEQTSSSSSSSRLSPRRAGGQSAHQSLPAQRRRPSSGAGSRVEDLSSADGLSRCTRSKTGKSSERQQQQAMSAAAPSRGSRASRKRSGDTEGLPETSTAWLHPRSEIIPSCRASQFHEVDRSAVRARWHERLLALPSDADGAAEHSFLLSVDTSEIPHAGRGLFITYLGPDMIWKVPGYVDLGRYGPHQASDIKRDFIMEVKNFVFQDRPGNWAFDGFLGLDKSEPTRPLTLFGKDLVQDVIFDIADDTTGDVHQLAEETLLPFVNEVTAQSGRGRGKGSKVQQVQNIDAVHHDDGSLHYLLRAGSTFRRGEETELLVYYGQQYEGNRHRKHDAYVGNAQKKSSSKGSKKDVSEDAGPSMRNSSILVSADESDDMSTLSNRDENACNVQKDAEFSVLTSSRNVMTHVCTKCMERSKKVCSKTPISTSNFTNMRKSVFTYTERDVVAVLDLFIKSPPIDSVARCRMWWILVQIRSYLSQILFRRKGSTPVAIRGKLQRALDLFPRKSKSPHHEEDIKVVNSHKYLGVAVRKEKGSSGFKTGMVEEIVERDGPGNVEDGNSLAQKEYLVVYFSGEGEEILPESEIQDCRIPNDFGMMG